MNTTTWPCLALSGLVVGSAARHVAWHLAAERAHPHPHRPRRASPIRDALSQPTLVPELLGVAGFVLAGWIGGGDLRVAALCWLVAFALPAVLVDAAVQRLPDVLTWPCLAGVVVLSFAEASANGNTSAGVRAIVTGAVVAGAFLALALFAGVGVGDVKLAASLAVVLGYVSWGAVAAGIAAGFCLAGLQAAGALLIQRRGIAAHIPLGPALLAGAFLALVLTRR